MIKHKYLISMDTNSGITMMDFTLFIIGMSFVAYPVLKFWWLCLMWWRSV